MSSRSYTHAELMALPALISVAQAAEVVGVSSRHMLRLCDRGDVPSVRLGGVVRIRTAELLERLGLADVTGALRRLDEARGEVERLEARSRVLRAASSLDPWVWTGGGE